MTKLSQIEANVLSAWSETSEEMGFGFDETARRCTTPRHQIRRAVRALARKGMLRFCRTLWREDEGTPMGGGYVLTAKGYQHLHDEDGDA